MVQFKDVFTGAEKRALRARRDVAEVRARRRQAQRPRERRLHRAPPHLLRDAGQLLVRRLLQGAGDRARLGAAHQGVRPAEPTGCWSPSSREDDEAAASGRRSPACPTSGSSASRPRTISGRWATPARAARARRSSTTTATHIPGGPPGSPDEDGDRFIEIWNLVFMQFEQLTDGRRACRCPSRRRHRHGPGAHRRGPAGHAQQLRHRPVPRADRGRGARDRRRSRRRAIGVAPGDRRPSARHVVPDRRRRAAVERGPRLRAAPHHAPRHAPWLHAGRAGAVGLQAGADAGARDGRCLSRAGARAAADHRDAEARGRRASADAGHRPEAARGRDRGAERRRHAARATSPSSSTTPSASRST